MNVYDQVMGEVFDPLSALSYDEQRRIWKKRLTAMVYSGTLAETVSKIRGAEPDLVIIDEAGPVDWAKMETALETVWRNAPRTTTTK